MTHELCAFAVRSRRQRVYGGSEGGCVDRIRPITCQNEVNSIINGADARAIEVRNCSERLFQRQAD